MGGAIGFAGGELHLAGESVLSLSVGSIKSSTHTTYYKKGAQLPIRLPELGSYSEIRWVQNAFTEPPRGSYCNFNQNNAWGNAVDSGAGGGIYHMALPFGGTGVAPKLTITGCNFWRNYAYNPWTNSFKNGGAIGGL